MDASFQRVRAFLSTLPLTGLARDVLRDESLQSVSDLWRVRLNARHKYAHRCERHKLDLLLGAIANLCTLEAIGDKAALQTARLRAEEIARVCFPSAWERALDG